MRYFDLREQLKDCVVFSVNDIRNIEPDFDLRRLSEWVAKGLIKRIRRGFYVFADISLEDETLFIIANKIYQPSYISYETALSSYGIIPEAVFGVTSATTLKTQDFNTSAGHFIYRRIKPELFFGYYPEQFRGGVYKKAYLEKAILDHLYSRPDIGDQTQFRETRFKTEPAKALIKEKRFREYAQRFNNQALFKRAQNFINYLDHAEF